MTRGSFQPRRIGSHLLVAALGEDSLGTIFRALHATDEKRFVRFRILQSPELSPPAVFSAIARHGKTVAHLSHKSIVQQAELAVADGSPYFAWYEGAGWTLDTVLLRLRSAGTALPTPFALLIAERVCAALEHAWFSPKDGEPIRHGLLWPGFVSISIDAEVRLGGFGLADAVLPSVMRGRLARDIAPYAAPEARDSGLTGPPSDAYSAGVLLLELLTCRRPVVSAARSDFRAEDGFTDDINRLLESCFAAPEERPSILELHRALQEQLAAGGSPISSADLAYFLYTLLNPESRGVPTNDHEATNPISAEDLRPFEVATPFLERRDDDLEEGAFSRPVAVTAREHEVEPGKSSTDDGSGHRDDRPGGEANPRRSARPPRPMTARRWISGAVYFSVAAAIILGFEGLAIHRERSAAAALRTSTSAALHIAAASPLRAAVRRRPEETAPPRPAPRAPESPLASRLVTVGQRDPAGKEMTGLETGRGAAAVVAPARRSARDPEAGAARKAAEDARFQAAWARIEAERGEARELAPDAFDRGRGQETEGERLLRAGDLASAREAFERAAGAFREADDHSRQARLGRIRLSSPSS